MINDLTFYFVLFTEEPAPLNANDRVYVSGEFTHTGENFSVNLEGCRGTIERVDSDDSFIVKFDKISPHMEVEGNTIPNEFKVPKAVLKKLPWSWFNRKRATMDADPVFQFTHAEPSSSSAELPDDHNAMASSLDQVCKCLSQNKL